MRGFLSDNALLDSFGMRALAWIDGEGATLGECQAAVAAAGHGDATAWHDAWIAQAAQAAALGDAALAAGERGGARGAYFRASNYARVAYLPLFGGPPVDPRLVAAYDLQVAHFQRGAALADHVVEPIVIPFAGNEMAGYLVRPDANAQPRPTLIHTDGYDGAIEEMYFAHALPAVAHGYNALLFDGPGQGKMLIHDGVPLRPDWEVVVQAVLDYAATRPEIDPAKMVLSGWSFGGYLAARAASYIPAFAGLIVDPGMWDMRDDVLARVPGANANDTTLPKLSEVAVQLEDRLLRNPHAPAAMRWAMIQRGLWVNGQPTLLDYINDMMRYELSPNAARITCPTLATQAMADDRATAAPTFLANIGATDKTLLEFTAAEGAGDHCELGNRALYSQRVFPWLRRVIGPGIPAGA